MHHARRFARTRVRSDHLIGAIPLALEFDLPRPAARGSEMPAIHGAAGMMPSATGRNIAPPGDSSVTYGCVRRLDDARADLDLALANSRKLAVASGRWRPMTGLTRIMHHGRRFRTCLRMARATAPTSGSARLHSPCNAFGVDLPSPAVRRGTLPLPLTAQPA